MGDKESVQIYILGSVIRPAGWLLIGVFGIAAIWSHHDGAAVSTSLGFVAAVLVGICMLFLSPRYEISATSLVEQQFEARYEIKWDEVTRVVTNPYGICFQGVDKAFCMPPPSHMTGSEVNTAFEIIDKEIKRRNLPVDENVRFGYSHRNVRVQRTKRDGTV
jgi:hypothetical protein